MCLLALRCLNSAFLLRPDIVKHDAVCDFLHFFDICTVCSVGALAVLHRLCVCVFAEQRNSSTAAWSLSCSDTGHDHSEATVLSTGYTQWLCTCFVFFYVWLLWCSEYAQMFGCCEYVCELFTAGSARHVKVSHCRTHECQRNHASKLLRRIILSRVIFWHCQTLGANFN